MKILNLYAGVGGNRLLWGDEHEVTAVENDPDIATVYFKLYPQDKVIVDDAHDYLLKHYMEYDFIWSSPPCPTHSQIRYNIGFKADRKYAKVKAVYPDMKLYEEIIFLNQFYKGKFVVENVRSYYKPLIPPQEIQSHYFWSNFHIPPTGLARKKVRNDKGHTLAFKMKQQGIYIKNFYNYKRDKRTLLNNCVEPELGQHIFNAALKETKQEQLL